jgi:hypothetical protein
VPPKPKPERPLPKTLGQCADALYTTRQERLLLQKQVDDLAAYEQRLKDHIIATLPKSDQTGAAGKLARVTVGTKQVPTVKDWEALYKYVKRSGSFELLQRRLGDAAIQERWAAGKAVPGVEPFTVVTVSVNKV